MKRNISMMQNVGVVHAALFVLVLLLAQSVAGQVGATYYVSTTGNDSNPGTLAQPWLTIQHAANTVTAGATVNVMGGVYNAYVSFPNSGTASAPITFQSYPVLNGTTVQPAVIDGTGLTVSGTKGLITISGARSYITVSGFEIRNLSSASGVPCGVWITGSGTGVQIQNNLIHNIVTTKGNGNGCGLFAYGTSQTPISGLVVNGNELYNLQTGESESMTLNGNVTNFQVTNNLIHDNSNIGIDIIGYEGTGPVGYDEASYGVVSGNTVYNISGIANAGEDAEYDADGLYCDGCGFVTFERNVIFQVDYGIETTSENTKCQITGTEWPGPDGVGTPATGKFPCYGRYATVRNNLFYYENACGNSIGGYALAKAKGGGGNGGGSSFHDVFVNNTLFDNGDQPGNADEGTPSGDFQTQYQLGTQQADYFENNVIYESASSPYSVSPNMWINSYVPATQVYPPGLTYTGAPATLNWNLYDSVAGYVQGTSILWTDINTYTSFANYQTTTGEDANSVNADPLFVNFGDTPPNVETNTDSPAVGAGSTSLSCSVGWCDPNGSSPSSIYGSTDFLGNPRTNGSSIDIGAYQNTGNAISNSMTVNLTSGASTLQYGQGQSTTLTVTVTALPGVGGAPSGTVNLMLGPTLLETATLLPTGPNSTAATMPLSASQLAAGANTLTAVYSGNSIAPCCSPSEPPGGSQTPIPWYSSATSAPITVTETPATTSIAVTSVSPASEDYGLDTPVTITAVLSWTGNGVAPTASDVTIGGNGPSGTYVTTGCSAPSGTTMTCTGTYTPTVADTAGSYTETATFAGDSNYSGSSSAQTNNFTINQASATTVVTTSGSPSIYGQSVTFTATINGENGLVKGRNGRAKPQDVSGSVTWSANTGCGTTPVTTGNPGTATCTTSILNAGSDTITATYSGDSNHGGSTATLSGGQTVNQASQTITVSVPAPPTATNGSSFTVVATGGGSGNPVVFTSFGACSNLRGTYTMNLGKACTVTMNQAGNANYTAAPTVTETTTEAAAIAPTVSVTVPASAPYQSTFTPVATTNASTTPTITVAPATVCTISGGVVTMENGTGTCSVTAKWAADDVYKAANATAKTTASKLASVVTWATPDPITYGTALSATQLDATASVPGMFVYTPASGKVLAVGTQTLSVKFTPTQSTDYTTVTGTTVPLVVNPANTTTTITTTSVNPSIIGHAVTVYYAVASPGKVTGSVAVTASSGETCGGPVAEATGLGSCRLTLQTVGSITLTATYGGDANNNGSVSAGFTQTVN